MQEADTFKHNHNCAPNTIVRFKEAERGRHLKITKAVSVLVSQQLIKTRFLNLLEKDIRSVCISTSALQQTR